MAALQCLNTSKTKLCMNLENKLFYKCAVLSKWCLPSFFEKLIIDMSQKTSHVEVALQKYNISALQPQNAKKLYYEGKLLGRYNTVT